MLKKQEIKEITIYTAEDIVDLNMGAREKSQYLTDTYRAYRLNKFISWKKFVSEVNDKINKLHYGIL